eukprot:TRINITY_DN888_c0_g1_i1.p1 TRINITY_DN888_c0_g1~~TRINITY_DN888_c0_g1_i1.p1  ORF type:complete len:262 (+),score=64.29 TRINITY_DN888_c0_g1_i1:116-787(+)
MAVWRALMDAIPAYTGLSPVTFFTLLALLVGIYHLAIGIYGGSPTQRASREAVEMEPIPAPVQLGEVTEEELRAYDGSDPKKPLLMAIKGQIYDVTQSRMFYGPGGPYALFAGRDASRALAKMSFDEQDLNANLEGLGPFELDTLQDWEFKFQCKYVKVGTIKTSSNREVEVTGAEGSNDAASEKATTDNHEKVESIEEVKENKVGTDDLKHSKEGDVQTTEA